MLDVLHFIFSSFWVWLGVVILVGGLGESFAKVVRLITGK